MKLQVLLCAALACPVALVAGQGPSKPVPAASTGQAQSKPAPAAAAPQITHLRKQGTATQLIVDGKPFLALAG